MPRWKVYWPTSAAALVVAGAIAVAANAAGMFVEPGVQVLREFDGTAQSSSFGWAVSELGDVDGDHVNEAIVGEPFTDAGSTYVYSGRTGALLYRFDGASGDLNGFSMADAGDVNGDHVHDILVGAPATTRGTSTSTRARPACSSTDSPGSRQATPSAGASRAPAMSTTTATRTS
jgi:hypothetical protein